MRWLVFALVTFATAALAQDPTLDQARSLIDAKRPAEAFNLLSPLEQARAGDPQFDYLLGLAAVDSGQYTRGVFALERVLAVQPDHVQARAEIARAYFLMGENRTARQEFQAVKETRPPPQVAATVDRFLDALEERERARRPSGLTGYLEASIGHDTNANAATSTSGFAIPIVPGVIFSPTPGSAKEADDFWSLAGGISGRYALSDSVALIGGGSFDQRWNSSLDQFDTGSLNANGGVSVKHEADEYVIAAQGQQYSVDNNRFRDALGFVAQWRRMLSRSNQVSAYLQRTRLDYPGQEDRNTDRTVLGGAWAHAYGGANAAFAGLYVGEESTRRDNVPHFGDELWGVRAGGQLGAGERWVLGASAAYEERRYGGPDPLFLDTRRDEETLVRLSASYFIDRNWSATAAFQYTDNRSNIVIYDYDRSIASFTVRYDFR